MSLNKFTDINQENKWMKINCGELSTPKLTIKATNGSSINMIPDSVGVVNQVLSSNGDGTVDWKTVSGGSGIQNPVLETIYPATNSIDLGTLAAPFRKLYVQNSTIELVNPTDPLKSGSISVNDGNLDIKSNLATGNVNLGYLAGVGAGENSTNIGNEAGGTNAGDNVVNLGFQAGKEDCKNNSINIGNGAGIQNSGENSIHIGTLAGSTILGGVNGDSSIAIGQSAGQNNIANNSIIINATGLVLDNLVEDAFIVKPIRDQPSYTKILGYDTSSGEIFSSDEKNTLNPVVIANPQVEKNIETKNDNTNALVVLQPTIGDTELLGGEIRINNIAKTNTAKLKNDLLEIKDSSSKNYQNSFSIEISDEKVSNLKSIITRYEFEVIADAIVRSKLDANSLYFRTINNEGIYQSDGIYLYEPLVINPRMELNNNFLKFTTADTKYISEYNNKFLELKTNNTIVDLPYMKLEADLVGGIQNAITSYKDFIINVAGNQRVLVDVDKAEFKDATGLITSNYGRTLSNIINTNDGNRQTASTIEVSDEKTANIKSTLTKTSLNIINSSNNTECEITAPQIYMSNIGNTHRLILSKDDISFIDVSANSNVINPTSYSLYQTGNLGTPVTELNQTSLVLRTTSLTPEIMTLNNSSVSFNSPINSTANSLSNTQLSMIDSSLNRSLLTRLALQFFEPSSTTIATASLNQTGLEIKDTSLTPEISSLTNGFLNISSPINNCVASLSSTTLTMLDIPSTHGTTVDKDLISIIDTTQNISNLTSTSLKLFLSTDLSNPATLLNQTKLEIKSTDDRTTINSTELKVQNTTTGKTCSLLNTGLSGNGIAIIPTAGTDISLTISAGGHILLNGLPSSNAGLPSGALYTHVIGGGHKSVCVV
jgi:hypothetical protein